MFSWLKKRDIPQQITSAAKELAKAEPKIGHIDISHAKVSSFKSQLESAYNIHDAAAQQTAPNQAPERCNDFSFAMRYLKAGHKLQRKGWNGKGQYVVAQVNATVTSADKIWNVHNKEHAIKLGGTITVAPYLTLKTAQDTLAMGWIPSTGDLFAEDWQLVD